MPAFSVLQQGFVRRVEESGLDQLDCGTIVVVPSITFSIEELRKIVGIEHYEERLLCLLLLLQNPSTRIVYVTSVEVDADVVDYYLSFVADPVGARSRLWMIATGDPAPRALSAKLLERPDLLDSVRAAAGEAEDGFIFPFNVTPLEQRLAEALGLPLYGPAPELMRFGTKSGAREVARRAGVPVLEGTENVRSLDGLERAVTELRRRRPGARAVVVKLNNGFSGQGNAIIDLADLASPIDRAVTVFCAEEECWASYGPKIAAEGAIVEEQLRVAGLVSPSVQMRIAPGGQVEVLSTHEQILGGPDDQVYLGCRFPARPEYRGLIQKHGRDVGAHLAAQGVMGLFGIDFVVVPTDGGYVAFLSEINLRVGGTTHPFLTAKGVTGGTYDPGSGELLAGGHPVRYVASDNIKSKRYVGLAPGRAIEALERRGIAYDPATRFGATLHLLGALPRYGKVGTTCLAGDLEEAAQLHDEVVVALDSAARSH